MSKNKYFMFKFLKLTTGILCAFLLVSCGGKTPKELNALLITGGCCHDYTFQASALTKGLSERLPIKWTVRHEGGDKRLFVSEAYDDPGWAKNYDVVIYNECFSFTTGSEYIKKVVNAHKEGVPAIVIHCAMHTYRKHSGDEWREFLGVTTKKHDHQSRYPVTITNAKHPIMNGFPKDWVSPMDELYIIDKLWPNAHVLATSVSEKTGDVHPVFWTNKYGKTRVFGSTFGHTNETITDPNFQDILARGILWVTE